MSNSSLDISWAYGFSKDVIGSVHSLCTKERNALFFLSSHSGVIYDFEHRKQTILQGHCNVISCCITDKTKRWIVTADTGPDSILIIWDSYTFMPVKTFSNPHSYGTHALDISDDGTYIATLGAINPETNDAQEIAIWAWTGMEETSYQRAVINLSNRKPFHNIKFNPSNMMELVTTSVDNVIYWDWSSQVLESYMGKMSKGDLGHFSGEYTSTIFLPDAETSLTSTSHGYVIVWENRSNRKPDPKNDPETLPHTTSSSIKSAVKVVKILDCGINLMEVTANHYLVLACGDGAVRFYDYFLRLEAWFEEIHAGPILSLSFAIQDCPYQLGEGGTPGSKFWVPDFLISTKHSFIVGLEALLFDEIRKEDRRGTLLMQGMSDTVVSITTHPYRPLVAILCKNGTVQLWDYEMKLLMNLRELYPSSSATPSSDLTTGAGTPVSHPGTTHTTGKQSKHGPGHGPGHSHHGPGHGHGSGHGHKHTVQGRDIAFHKDGHLLAIGFSNGSVKLLSTETLQDVQQFHPNADPVLQVKFSPSGKYLAVCDEHHHLLLFQRDMDPNPPKPLTPTGSSSSPQRGGGGAQTSFGTSKDNGGFYYVGRTLAHTAKIIGLEFGFRETTIETLITVSEDQYCVEYDLLNSSLTAGILPVKMITPTMQSFSAVRLEKNAKPTCVLWCPKNEDDIEDKFVVMNSDFKMKEYNIDSKQCRKLSLAPRYGFPATQILLVPHTFRPAPGVTDGEQGNFLATYVFTTGQRILGVGHFPLDGNPAQTMGVVAHPGEITRVAVSHDGVYVFSAGGSDLSVNMWTLSEHLSERMSGNVQTLSGNVRDVVQDPDILGQYTARCQMMSYYDLLDDGPFGELHQNIVDYFYYCQLRHGGEDTMDTRTLTGHIPLEEIPALVRAIGFYPTEEEVTQMINEIRYKSFMVTGMTQDTIGLDEFIRLYVNHRPAIPLEKQLVGASFDVIASRLVGDSNRSVQWAQLQQLLTTEGEKIELPDLQTFFGALVGESMLQQPSQPGGASEYVLHPETRLNAAYFATKILGFEDDDMNG